MNSQLTFTLLVAILTFIFQRSLTNVISGILLRIAKPFKKNDSVTILQGHANLVSGRIDSIGLISTLVKTYEKQFVSIPNAMLLDNCTIINHTRNPKFNFMQKIDLSTDSDILEVKKFIKDLVIAHPLTYNTLENTKIKCRIVNNTLEVTYNVKTINMEDSYIACDEILDSILVGIYQSEKIFLKK